MLTKSLRKEGLVDWHTPVHFCTVSAITFECTFILQWRPAACAKLLFPQGKKRRGGRGPHGAACKRTRDALSAELEDGGLLQPTVTSAKVHCDGINAKQHPGTAGLQLRDTVAVDDIAADCYSRAKIASKIIYCCDCPGWKKNCLISSLWMRVWLRNANACQ